MHTDVNACDCTWGCTDTVRESALKVDSGRKIPCRTGESNLRRQHADLMLYQLSYIPTPTVCVHVIHTDMHTHTQSQLTHTHTACQTCIHSALTHTCARARARTHTHIYTHTHARTQTHTCIHTHTHTHTHLSLIHI